MHLPFRRRRNVFTEAIKEVLPRLTFHQPHKGLEAIKEGKDLAIMSGPRRNGECVEKIQPRFGGLGFQWLGLLSWANGCKKKVTITIVIS